MREAAFTYKEISAKAGVPWTNIRYFCQRNGIEPQIKVFRERRKRGYKLDGRESEVRRLYWGEGLSERDTAAALGVPKSTLVNFMNARGIERRDQKQATTMAFRGSNPPRRDGHRAWDSDQAREAAKASAEVRRRKADRNRRRRERYATQKAA